MIRKLAYETLERIDDDKAYSHLALNAVFESSDLDARDRGLVTSIVYGTLTWQRALDLIIGKFSKRKTFDIQSDVLRALRIGVYQLCFLDRVPDHAAIHETVELTKAINVDAAGFVNAILRKVSKNKTQPWWRESDRENKSARYVGEKYALPNWLSNRLVQQLKIDEAEKVAEGFSKLATNYIRVRKSDLEYGKIVEGFPDARSIEGIDEGVRKKLETHEIVVQDLGAQRIVLACGDVKGKRVLDACAGMGGKSLYLSDRGAHVTAVEPHAARLEKLRERNLEIECFTGELGDFLKKDSQAFDVVLVDAPCSALGVIRRHPETKWSRRESDINRLEKLQHNILNDAAKLVNENGKLIYAVCTFSREETTKQVEKFLENHLDFVKESEIQLWPNVDDCDAFFIARFRKK